MLTHHRGSVLLSAVAVLALLTACGDSPESLSEDMVDTMNEGADIFASIQDEDSAKAASSKLESWAEDMRDLQKRMEAIEKPSKEEDKALQEMYGDKMREANGRFQKEMMRVATDAKLAPHLAETMKRVGEALQNSR